MKRAAIFLLVATSIALSADAPTLESLRAAFEAKPGIASAERLAKAFLKEKKLDEGLRFFAVAPSADAPQRGICAYGRGFLRQAARDWNTALKDYEEALDVFQSSGDTVGEAATLHVMGSTYYASSRFREALAVMERSLVAREKSNDSVGAARARMGIGAAHWALGDYAETAKLFGAALTVFEAAEERAVTAQLLNNLGGLHWALGDYAEALSFFKRSLDTKRSMKENLDIAGTLNNLGTVHSSMGDYARALACYEESLAVSGSGMAEVTAMGNIGQVYWLLGDNAKGLSFLRRGLDAALKIGDRAGEARMLNTMGAVHRNLGDLALALDFYEKSLAVKMDIGDKAGAARALTSIGVVHESMGDREKARDLYQRSLTLFEEMGDKSGISQSLASLCKAKFGGFDAAVARGERALVLARKTDAEERMYEAHAALGALFAEAGEREAAAAHYRSAIEAVESMRALLSESEHKSGFLEMKLLAYEQLVELLIADFGLRIEKSPSLAEAFSVAERMKARSFLDDLGAAKLSRAGAPEALLQEKRILEARMKWLKERAQ